MTTERLVKLADRDPLGEIDTIYPEGRQADADQWQKVT